MIDWEQTVRKVSVWIVAAGLFIGLIFLIAYRYCEQAGPLAAKSCVAAGITAAVSGMIACWPLLKIWDRHQTAGVMAVIIGGGMRILAGFIGVVVILVFVDVSRGWFLACFGLFYIAFMLTGSWMTVRLLQHRSLKENEPKYDEFRDIACQHGSARRNYK